MKRALAVVALATPFALGAAALPDAQRVPRSFTFKDAEIVESSGLAFVDGLAVTVNDSGDSGRVFAVDPATGRTVGVTRWADDPRDVEAVAPAGGGAVWVGDIGDNTASREDIEVARVPVQRGDVTVDPEVHTLRYPGGARDAETLLAHPRTGRLFVVSKGVFGGDVFAVPKDLDGRMRSLGLVLPLATDGAFFPDGRHLILRSYGRAAVYRWPSLATVTTMNLPPQEQGEGIAVTDDNRVFLSSEGAGQPVLELPLPKALRDVVAPAPAPPSTTPTTPTTPTTTPLAPSAEDAATGLRDRDAWPLWVAGGALGAGLLALWVVRRTRRRR